MATIPSYPMTRCADCDVRWSPLVPSCRCEGPDRWDERQEEIAELEVICVKRPPGSYRLSRNPGWGPDTIVFEPAIPGQKPDVSSMVIRVPIPRRAAHQVRCPGCGRPLEFQTTPAWRWHPRRLRDPALLLVSVALLAGLVALLANCVRSSSAAVAILVGLFALAALAMSAFMMARTFRRLRLPLLSAAERKPDGAGDGRSAYHVVTFARRWHGPVALSGPLLGGSWFGVEPGERDGSGTPEPRSTSDEFGTPVPWKQWDHTVETAGQWFSILLVLFVLGYGLVSVSRWAWSLVDPGIGDPCEVTRDCWAPLICHHGFGPPQCNKHSEAGQACTQDSDCRERDSGRFRGPATALFQPYCRDGVCREPFDGNLLESHLDPAWLSPRIAAPRVPSPLDDWPKRLR